MWLFCTDVPRPIHLLEARFLTVHRLNHIKNKILFIFLGKRSLFFNPSLLSRDFLVSLLPGIELRVVWTSTIYLSYLPQESALCKLLEIWSAPQTVVMWISMCGSAACNAHMQPRQLLDKDACLFFLAIANVWCAHLSENTAWPLSFYTESVLKEPTTVWEWDLNLKISPWICLECTWASQ